MIAILTILTYLGALHFGAVAWIAPLRNESTQTSSISSLVLQPKKMLILGSIACLLHFLNVFQLLVNGEGQNFTLVNVASLISMIMSLFATMVLPRWKTMWLPITLIYALSIINVAVSNFVSGSVIKHLSENTGLLFHLAIAVFSYALFFIALLYAIQLKWLDKKLKNKQLLSPNFPALMTVERHFFYLTLCAQGLLTIALITGMIYLHNFFANEHIHKAIFASLAWFIYSILLLGQWKLRWRGNRVLIYSISGMILLSFAYFGSRLV